MMKKIIINADDFGMSKIFNKKIIELLNLGVVSSTSVLVNRNLASQKDQILELINLKENKNISIGLHFEHDEDNSYENILSDLENQYKLFMKLVGVRSDNLDKHKWIYTEEEAKAIADFAKKENLIVRKSQSGKMDKFEKEIMMADRAFSVTDHTFEEVLDFLESIRKNEICELISHPGEFDPNCRSSLNKQREEDVKKLIAINKKLSELGIKVVSSKCLKK